MTALPASYLLALRQLFDPQILRILLKSVLVSLAIFAALGLAGWYAIDALLAGGGLTDTLVPGAGGIRGALAFILSLIGLWLLWRIVAMAVVQFFADDVVAVVEAKHYPGRAMSARTIPMGEQVRASLRAAGRALLVNLIALPVALALLVTGVGTAFVFLFVNAILLGRELQDMVWSRHVAPDMRAQSPVGPPVGPFQRFGLGGVAAVLLSLPGINLVAPVLGAAASTHLVHRNMGHGDVASS